MLGVALPLLLLSLSPSHVTPVAPNGVGAGHGFTPQASRAQAVATRNARPVGFATYYARTFDGRTTASGTRFDSDAMVAAHPTYPFGTLVRVTNLRNGRSAKVRIVDRGPASGPRRKGVIIDLSRAAAEYLGFVRAGRARVRLDVLS